MSICNKSLKFRWQNYQLICCCCCFCLFAIADESCTKFYVPDKNSPLTLGVCDGGSCKCVNGKLEQLLTLLSFIF